MKEMQNKYLLMVFVVLGFIFLRSSWGKITGGKFVSGLSGTLEKFASNNPYPWYKDFLTNVAIPNSQLFGMMTMWGELLAGLGLFGLSVILLLGVKGSKFIFSMLGLSLVGAMIMNGFFWLAAGYTSPSTDGLNLVMFLIEAIGLSYILKQLAIGSKNSG